MKGSFDIKYQEHFKLYISLKEKMAFEAALNKNEIAFHLDDSELGVYNYSRYFLLNNDGHKIDEIIKATGIIASTETITMTDYSDVNNFYKIYLYIALITVVVFVIARLILLHTQ